MSKNRTHTAMYTHLERLHGEVEEGTRSEASFNKETIGWMMFQELACFHHNPGHWGIDRKNRVITLAPSEYNDVDCFVRRGDTWSKTINQGIVDIEKPQTPVVCDLVYSGMNLTQGSGPSNKFLIDLCTGEDTGSVLVILKKNNLAGSGTLFTVLGYYKGVYHNTSDAPEHQMRPYRFYLKRVC